MKKLFILLVNFYRRFISPLKPPCCRYYPTCSSYALEAFKKHGAIKGLILAIWRLLRCNPWSGGGVDYVPDKFHLYTLKSEHKRKSTQTKEETEFEINARVSRVSDTEED